MKLVVTLRTRDQLELVDANVAFHLAAGADLVLATDHRSVDGTREALRRHERAGRLVLITKDEERYSPGEWVNDMARLAALEHGADWVVHVDADEFWWPRGGSLKEVLAAVPDRYGVLLCPWRHFAPRPDDGRHFAERMTLRLSSHSPWARPEDPFHPNVNVAHRGHPDVDVRPGNHDVHAPFEVLRGWHPIEVMHFPLRSRAQAEAKFRAWSRFQASLAGIAPHVDAAGSALEEGAFDAFYGRYVVDPDAEAKGLAEGVYAIDTRLRDALRLLAGDGSRALPAEPGFASDGGPRLRFAQPDEAESAALAVDTNALQDPHARVLARVERFERRLSVLERRRLRGTG